MKERTLTKQAKTRLRRIEGQVRGLQSMLERISEEPKSRKALAERVRELVSIGKRQKEIAQDLDISRESVSEIAKGKPLTDSEPCGRLLTQVLAVRGAVEQVGLLIMELHLQRCVLGNLAEDDERMKGLHESLKLWSRLSSAR